MAWKTEAVRIGAIVLIALGARLLLDLLRWVNAKTIQRSFGAYLSRSARALTLNKLTFSILKYAVYVLALGLILREFGVSLAAYLAGASILSFAVAFGFQGLIQDLISGAFVIIEDQFAVGHMVEIGGQIGRVEEIGLRVTKIRNYLGELFLVPNRALGNVGTFPLGCVSAVVADPADGGETEAVLRDPRRGGACAPATPWPCSSIRRWRSRRTARTAPSPRCASRSGPARTGSSSAPSSAHGRRVSSLPEGRAGCGRVLVHYGGGVIHGRSSPSAPSR
jgi:hypothetical protein